MLAENWRIVSCRESSHTSGLRNAVLRSPHCDSAETNPTSIHEDAGRIPGLPGCIKDLVLPRGVVSVCCRPCSDGMLPWLWCRPATAAPIQPLAWEPPYASARALIPKKKKKNEVWRVAADIEHEGFPLQLRDPLASFLTHRIIFSISVLRSQKALFSGALGGKKNSAPVVS